MSDAIRKIEIVRKRMVERTLASSNQTSKWEDGSATLKRPVNSDLGSKQEGFREILSVLLGMEVSASKKQK